MRKGIEIMARKKAEESVEAVQGEVKKKGRKKGQGREKKQEKSGERVIQIVVPEEISMLFSEEVMSHLANARREMLLAVRSLIDRRLGALEKEGRKGRKPKVVKIEVE